MRIFVYELICAGGLGSNPPQSLQHEGWGMLAALVEDLAQIQDVWVMTLLAEGLLPNLGHECRRASSREEPRIFRELAEQANLTVVIAPESDDLLTRRSEDVLAAGGRLLGSEPDAIRLTGDKLAISRHWLRHDIPSPLTNLASTLAIPGCPSVLKPRHGAGSQATYLVHDPADWPSLLRAAQSETNDSLIVQPYVTGLACSVAFLIGPIGSVSLLPAEQRLSQDGRLRYEGGRIPLSSCLAVRAEILARRAISVVQGLHGYVGVDLVLGAQPEDDVAIEINPRLTTSYLGLRRLCRGNLAAHLLRIAQGEMSNIEWLEGNVVFDVH